MISVFASSLGLVVYLFGGFLVSVAFHSLSKRCRPRGTLRCQLPSVFQWVDFGLSGLATFQVNV